MNENSMDINGKWLENPWKTIEKWLSISEMHAKSMEINENEIKIQWKPKEMNRKLMNKWGISLKYCSNLEFENWKSTQT